MAKPYQEYQAQHVRGTSYDNVLSCNACTRTVPSKHDSPMSTKYMSTDRAGVIACRVCPSRSLAPNVRSAAERVCSPCFMPTLPLPMSKREDNNSYRSLGREVDGLLVEATDPPSSGRRCRIKRSARLASDCVPCRTAVSFYRNGTTHCCP